MGMDSPLRTLHSKELNIMFYSCWRCVKAVIKTLPKRKQEWFWSSSLLLLFFSLSDPNQNPGFAKSLSILSSGSQSSRPTPPSIPISTRLKHFSKTMYYTGNLQSQLSHSTVLQAVNHTHHHSLIEEMFEPIM